MCVHRDVVNRVWATFILPLTHDPLLWTEKLLNIMRHLSDKGVEILISMSGIKEACVTTHVRLCRLMGPAGSQGCVTGTLLHASSLMCVLFLRRHLKVHSSSLKGGIIDQDEAKVTHTLHVCIQSFTGSSYPMSIPFVLTSRNSICVCR